MNIGPRLDLRQSQTLTMTPQLQQAIKLLQLSNQELEGFLAEEIDRNPLLEMDGGGGGDGPSDAPTDARDDSGAGQPEPSDPTPSTDAATASDRVLDDDATGGTADAALDVDFDAETFHHDGFGDRMDGTGSGGDSEGIDFDSFATAPGTLADHLMAQAGATLSGTDHAIALALIEQIDEAGRLTVELSELALRLNVPLAQVESVLAVIQTFDPAGVGARDLAECLALQAKEADRYDPAMACLIANLDLVAKGARAQLIRVCGVDDEDLDDMLRELRAYDPKPGLRFGGTPAAPVVPDVLVRTVGSGWTVDINSATLPRVLVNHRYHQQLAKTGSRQNQSWLSERLASANWLVRALEQRQATIIKVAAEIVRQQEGFFRTGVGALRPLTLRQVADVVGLHESTVSRVTSNKYLSCTRGVFELKYFFTRAIASSEMDGEAASASSVKDRIRALIQAESPDAVLSDDTLAQMLSNEGFDIARRTVVKYREAMGFGSSVQRRRAIRMGLR